MSPYYQLGRYGVLAIVLLRLCVGWHFFMEGQAKVKSGNFTSEGFLSGAKGPLAPLYHEAIWDHSGTIRLDQERVTKLFEDFKERAVKEYGMSAEQTEKAQKLQEKYVGQIDNAFSEWSEEIFKFNAGQPRREEMEKDPKRLFVASLRAQMEQIESERTGGVKPALSAISKIWTNYEEAMNELATEEQLKQVKSALSIVKPNHSPFQSDTVDKVLPYFDMVIGVLLILGLLTPIAATLAAGFLASVVLSQFPGFPGTSPTYFQAVECIACLVLATSDAGRYAGLDFIPYSIWQFLGSKKGTAAAA